MPTSMRSPSACATGGATSRVMAQPRLQAEKISKWGSVVGMRPIIAMPDFEQAMAPPAIGG
jgi:hypothetical protein